MTCWGTGTPLREFLHADDLGEACVFTLEKWQPGPGDLSYLNVGTGTDLSIAQLAQAVAKAIGFNGIIDRDTRKPAGTPKQQHDVSRLAKLGWKARISLSDGLSETVLMFRNQLSQQLLRY